MFVRVFDKPNQRYYRSMVYCTVGIGYDLQYVVVNPHTACFELVDYLDKTREPTPLVEIIQNDRPDWGCYENALLLKYKAWCRTHCKPMTLKSLRGYRDVCENYAFVNTILERRSVPLSQFDIRLRDLPDAGEWTYIHTQADADAFMKAFAFFHDSTLEKLTYEEGAATSKVTTVFDNRSWFGIAELCFEGVVSVNIRPPREHFTREIWEGSLTVRDEMVTWTDRLLKEEETLSSSGHIIALSLKWRKIG